MSKKNFKEKFVEKISDIVGDPTFSYIFLPITGSGILVLTGLFIMEQLKHPHQKEEEVVKAFYQNKTICCDHTPIINSKTKPLVKLFVKDGKLFVSDELGKKYDTAGCKVFEYKEMCELQ